MTERGSGSVAGMNWFKEQRMAWIAETIRIFGFINRQHLMRKFGISTPQASKDLNDFMRMYPNVLEYNLSAKQFIPRKPKPFDSPVDDIFDAFEQKQKQKKEKRS